MQIRRVWMMTSVDDDVALAGRAPSVGSPRGRIPKGGNGLRSGAGTHPQPTSRRMTAAEVPVATGGIRVVERQCRTNHLEASLGPRPVYVDRFSNASQISRRKLDLNR